MEEKVGYILGISSQLRYFTLDHPKYYHDRRIREKVMESVAGRDSLRCIHVFLYKYIQRERERNG